MLPLAKLARVFLTPIVKSFGVEASFAVTILPSLFTEIPSVKVPPQSIPTRKLIDFSPFVDQCYFSLEGKITVA
jgi:hypothetical protein